MSKTTNKIAFYAKNEEGTVDELILDLFERDFEYNENINERDLWVRHGGRGREFQLETAGLEKLFEIVEVTFNHGLYSNEIQNEEDEARRWRRRAMNREFVSKERVWKAIRWECGEEELYDLCSYEKYRYDKEDYYDFQLMIDKIHAFMAGECSVGYFISWLILLMRCLEEGIDSKKRRRKEIYFEISDLLDGEAFMSLDISEEEKRIDCLELIAVLKALDHKLKCIETKKNVPFTKNGVITYVTFVACINGKTELSKVCVVDEYRKTVNYLYVSDLIYREEVNYTFLTEAEFDCLTSRYYEYTFDETMKDDYAMTKSDS